MLNSLTPCFVMQESLCLISSERTKPVLSYNISVLGNRVWGFREECLNIMDQNPYIHPLPTQELTSYRVAFWHDDEFPLGGLGLC